MIMKQLEDLLNKQKGIKNMHEENEQKRCELENIVVSKSVTQYDILYLFKKKNKWMTIKQVIECVSDCYPCLNNPKVQINRKVHGLYKTKYLERKKIKRKKDDKDGWGNEFLYRINKTDKK